MIVNTSAATICETEAAKKEGTGDDFDSEANNEEDQLKYCLSLSITNSQRSVKRLYSWATY